MKPNFQMHEISRTKPFNVDSSLAIAIIECKEIVHNILNALLDLVVVVWFLKEGSYCHIEQYHQN